MILAPPGALVNEVGHAAVTSLRDKPSLGDIGFEGGELRALGRNFQSFRVTQRGILRCTSVKRQE
jgi:hypothetical protein